jgi:hypothetical protein
MVRILEAWYAAVSPKVRTTVCAVAENVTSVAELETELYSVFPAMVAVTLQVPVVPLVSAPEVIAQPDALPPVVTT